MFFADVVIPVSHPRLTNTHTHYKAHKRTQHNTLKHTNHTQPPKHYGLLYRRYLYALQVLHGSGGCGSGVLLLPMPMLLWLPKHKHRKGPARGPLRVCGGRTCIRVSGRQPRS